MEIGCYGVQIAGSPFIVSVWDATQVKVYNVPPAGRVGKPTTFNSASSFIVLYNIVLLCATGWKWKNRSAGMEPCSFPPSLSFFFSHFLSLSSLLSLAFPSSLCSFSLLARSRLQIQLGRPWERHELCSGSGGAWADKQFLMHSEFIIIVVIIMVTYRDPLIGAQRRRSEV